MPAFLVALLVSFAAAGPTIAVLAHRRVLDIPNARSSHETAVPRGGGVALLFGTATGVLVMLQGDLTGASNAAHPDILVASLAVGTLLLAGLGLRDDLRGLPASMRLVTQVALAAATSAAVVWTVPAGRPALLLVPAALWVVGCVNAYNFMDGVNGISAVTAALASGWFCLLAAQDHDRLVVAVSAALGGAALGFLPWNAPRARLFLGDVGSYGIGYLLACLALLTALREQNVWLGAAPMVVYVADTGWTLTRRARRREPLFQAHRSHAYQRLIDLGLSHAGSTGVVGASTGLVLAAAWFLPAAAAIGGAVLVAAAYLALPGRIAAHLERVTA